MSKNTDDEVDIDDLINEEYLDELMIKEMERYRFMTKIMLTNCILIGFVILAWVLLEPITVFHSLTVSLILTIITIIKIY